MIRTNEVLEDPAAYIEGNINVGGHLDEVGYQIVSGADYDVLIRPAAVEGRGALIHAVSPLLGRLYLQGMAYGVDARNRQVQLEWFPSPEAVNELSERLGLRPGEDVLRFTHAEQDRLPQSNYRAHLARHEYPQSIGEDRFTHDRDDTHAIATLLLPTSSFEQIVTSAETPNKKYVTRDLDLLIHYFDRGTHAAHVGLVEFYNHAFDTSDRFIRSLGSYIMYNTGVLLAVVEDSKRGFFSFESKSHQRQRETVALRALFEHYLTLRPRIEALQAEIPELTKDTVVA